MKAPYGAPGARGRHTGLRRRQPSGGAQPVIHEVLTVEKEH